MKREASSTEVILTSPDYPENYANNELCRWELYTNKDYEVVRIRFLDLAIWNSATCGEDYLEVRDGPNTWYPVIRRFCRQMLATETTMVTSTEKSMLLTFRTDNEHTDQGFRLQYWTVPKGSTEYKAPRLTLVNKILFGVFGLITSSIVFTIAAISVIRSNASLYAKYVKKSATRDKARAGHHEAALPVTSPSRDDMSEETLCYSLPGSSSLSNSNHTLTTPV